MSNHRAAASLILLFGALFLFSYLTRDSGILDFRETGSANAKPVGGAMPTLCPIGAYDRARGLIVIWRGDTAVVAERPWRCLHADERLIMVDELRKQHDGAVGLEILGEQTGDRLAFVAPDGTVTLD